MTKKKKFYTIDTTFKHILSEILNFNFKNILNKTNQNKLIVLLTPLLMV